MGNSQTHSLPVCKIPAVVSVDDEFSKLTQFEIRETEFLIQIKKQSEISKQDYTEEARQYVKDSTKYTDTLDDYDFYTIKQYQKWGDRLVNAYLRHEKTADEQRELLKNICIAWKKSYLQHQCDLENFNALELRWKAKDYEKNILFPLCVQLMKMDGHTKFGFSERRGYMERLYTQKTFSFEKFTDAIAIMAKDLRRIIEGSPPIPFGMILWRGISKLKRRTELGFYSTTYAPLIAQDFATENGVILAMFVSAGSKCLFVPYGGVYDEAEILLPPQAFEIQPVTKNLLRNLSVASGLYQKNFLYLLDYNASKVEIREIEKSRRDLQEKKVEKAILKGMAVKAKKSPPKIRRSPKSKGSKIIGGWIPKSDPELWMFYMK